MNGIIWFFLALVVVAITKYLTAMRLRHLRKRREKDQQDANELSRVLEQASEKENTLKTEIESLRTKVSAMQNVVVNLEKILQKSTTVS